MKPIDSRADGSPTERYSTVMRMNTKERNKLAQSALLGKGETMHRSMLKTKKDMNML